MAQPNDTPLADGVNTLFPPDFLKVVGFLIPADETTQELIDWYENIHSVNATVLWAHLDLYQRNYILDVEEGPLPTYRVVTEFIWKSEQEKKAAEAIFGTPAADIMLNEQFPSWMHPLDIPDTHGLVPVDSVDMAASAEHNAETTVDRRRIILLDRNPTASQAEFDAAAKSYAKGIANRLNVKVELDLCRKKASWPSTRAVIYVNDSAKDDFSTVDNKIFTVASIFLVKTAKSPICIQGGVAG